MGQIHGDWRAAHVARHFGVHEKDHTETWWLICTDKWCEGQTSYWLALRLSDHPKPVFLYLVYHPSKLVHDIRRGQLQHATPPGRQFNPLYWDELSNCNCQDWTGRLFWFVLHLKWNAQSKCHYIIIEFLIHCIVALFINAGTGPDVEWSGEGGYGLHCMCVQCTMALSVPQCYTHIEDTLKLSIHIQQIELFDFSIWSEIQSKSVDRIFTDGFITVYMFHKAIIAFQ